MGTILLKLNLIDKKQLAQALIFQKEHGCKIGEAFIELGYLYEEQVFQALARQFKCPYVNLMKGEISKDILELVPMAVVEEHNILPIKEVDGKLYIAMCDPLDMFMIDNLMFILGREIEIALTTPTLLKEAIEKYYPEVSRGLGEMYSAITEYDIDTLELAEDDDLAYDDFDEDAEAEALDEQRIGGISAQMDFMLGDLEADLPKMEKKKRNELKRQKKKTKAPKRYAKMPKKDIVPEDRAVFGERAEVFKAFEEQKQIISLEREQLEVVEEKIETGKKLDDEEKLDELLFEDKEAIGIQERTIPKFEQYLSDDAGTPGPLERIVAQSKSIMKLLQITLGVKFLLIANMFDIIIEAFTSYVHGIFRAWKMSKTVKRRMSRKDPEKQIKEMTKDFSLARMQISRIFHFPGFYPQIFSFQEDLLEKNLEASFALKVIIEARGHLDEMKRDLLLVTPKQVSKFVKNSLKDFLLSFIPNPADFLIPWKDFFILSWYMKYSRREIEEMYGDFLEGYQSILLGLKQKNTHLDIADSDTFFEYESHIIDEHTLDNQYDLDQAIEASRQNIQRFIQILCNPSYAIFINKWPKFDLIMEVKK